MTEGATPTFELDHIGVAVSDLDLGQAAYSRLGFCLTERSLHKGTIATDGQAIPWGSGNHCAMFERGYLEILGVTDSKKYSTARELVQRYEGAHIVALRCENADAVSEIVSRRVRGIGKPVILERDVGVSEHNETRLERARFKNIYLAKDVFPEARFILIEHLTPDLVWQRHQLSHPNTAVAISAVEICVDEREVANVAEKLGTLLGRLVARSSDGKRTIILEHGRIVIGSKSNYASRPAEPPCVTGIEVTVRDLDVTRGVLNASATPIVTDTGQQITVHPGSAHGTTIVFTS
jgi:hypothetical protein